MAGRPKVESARLRLLDLNPAARVDAFPEAFSTANAARIAAEYEIIVDCSDNLPTRILTNELCVQTGRPNVYGAVYRFEGQASIFYAKEGPCYRCLFSQTPAPEQVASGAQGVLSMLPGTIGTIQATEALKLILGIGSPLIGRLLLYNALEMSFEIFQIKKRPDCAVCGPKE